MKRHLAWSWTLVAATWLFSACGSKSDGDEATTADGSSTSSTTHGASTSSTTDGSSASAGDGDGDGTSGGSSLGGSSGTAMVPGDDLSGTGVDQSGLGRAAFRFGINHGHPNPNFSDADMSDLSSRLGIDSIRIKYPDYHFFNWGITIEVSDAEHYARNGQHDNVAFLIGMRQEYSTAPAGSEDWQRDYYIPKNLYEPIWTSSGDVNPDNYFATYLKETFSTYKDWVKYWEIWNEPDFIADWKISQHWSTEPPTKDELIRFNGSIFDYIRMLRIAKEVRDEFAPDTFVMTGGIGYASFLDAIVRYTDNPDGGTKSADFPETGDVYFDLVSFHHYPHLVESGASDAGLDSFVEHRDELQAVLDAHSITGKGYMVTEMGASHVAIENTASGPDYAINYAIKAFTWAKAAGFFGIDWYTLSDGDDAGDAFSNMGLYQDITALKAPSDAKTTDTGLAHQWLIEQLHDMRFDPSATDALELSSDARGYAFSDEAGSTVWVLWADSQVDETASVEVTVSTGTEARVYSWDGPSDGEQCADDQKCTVTLQSTPRIIKSR